MLLATEKHIQQPQAGHAVNSPNPLARDLVFCVEYANGAGREMVRNIAPTAVAGSRVNRVAPGFTGGNGAVYGVFSSSPEHYGDLELFPSKVCTWQVVELPTNVTQTAGLVNKRTNSSTNQVISFGYNYTAATFSVNIGTLTGGLGPQYSYPRTNFSTVVPNNIIITIDPNAGALAKMHLWLNGAELTALSATADIAQDGFFDGSTNWEIGRVNNSTLYYSGNIMLVRAWDRLLTTPEVRELSFGAGSWQVYTPPSAYWDLDFSSGAASSRLFGLSLLGAGF